MENLFTLDFSKLSNETFELSKQISADRAEVSNPNFINQRDQTIKLFQIGAVSSPGVIFSIEINKSTMILHGLPCTNIQESTNSILSGDAFFRQELKLNDNLPELEQLYAFPTRNYGLAEAVWDQMINKEFKAENLIGEDSEDWNLEITKSSIRIRFRHRPTLNDLHYSISIGPLYDSSLAAYKFNLYRECLVDYFSLSEFTCNDHELLFATTTPSSKFLDFKKLFLKGENFLASDQVLNQQPANSMKLFIDELTNTRQFWLALNREI